MNLLSWKCRGGGNSQTVRKLVTLVKSHSPVLCFLCETRQKEGRMRRIRGGLGLNGFASVDSNGMGGGFSLFWHESCTVDIIDKEDRYCRRSRYQGT